MMLPKPVLHHQGFCEDTPLLTIFIPTYNRPLLLRHAVDSALNQIDKRPVKICIIDNCSDLHVIAKIKELLVSDGNYRRLWLYAHTSNIGMYGNWNSCVNLCDTPYMSILSDDDLLHPAWLTYVFSACKSDFSIVVPAVYVFGDTCDFAKVESKYPDTFLHSVPNLPSCLNYSKISLQRLLYSMPTYGLTGAIFSAQVARDVGGFDPSAFPISDYDFLCRCLAKNSNLILIKAKLAAYRIADNESLKPATRFNFASKGFNLRRQSIVSIKSVPRRLLELIILVRFHEDVLKYSSPGVSVTTFMASLSISFSNLSWIARPLARISYRFRQFRALLLLIWYILISPSMRIVRRTINSDSPL